MRMRFTWELGKGGEGINLHMGYPFETDWSNAVIGRHYRPLKTQISFRIDSEVLDWLKSKGERMARER